MSQSQNAANVESGLGEVRNPAVNSDMAIIGHAMATGDSDLVNRYMAARNAGLAFGGDRDYYETLGYERHPTAESYFTKYLRNDIARRVVEAPAVASWGERPTVIDEASEGADDDAETDFEKAIEYLFDEHRLLHYLERVDKLTGIGEYGVLFLGVADADPTDARNPDDVEEGETIGLDNPVSAGDLKTVLDTKDDTTRDFDDLAYLATFSQARVEQMATADSPRNPRYGLPEKYQIEFSHGSGSEIEWVHHSRIIHIAEDLLENEIYGRPRLEAILNRLDDLEKVVGGSAEMFWRGADRKLQLNYTGDGAPADADELQEQGTEMVHGLRNMLQTTNTEVNELSGDDVDPRGVVEVILKLIAGETGIPLRMLTGSERGELASTQDRATFYERITSRQEQFCEPAILRPLIDRLVEFGILPEPRGDGYEIEWPDLFELNELEQAELMDKHASALKNAAPMGDVEGLAAVPEIRENVFDWGPEIGDETSVDVEDPEDEPDPAPEDIDDEDRDAFEDIFGDDDAAEGGPTPDDAGETSEGEALADGGDEVVGAVP